MSHPQEIEWEACMLEPRRDAELEREVRKALGLVPPAIPLFAPCAWLARAFVRCNLLLTPLVYAERALVDLISLAVSQANSCRYCYASQRALLRIQGFDEERIRQLQEAYVGAESDPGERRALEFARSISRSSPPPSAVERSALREAGFSDGAIREIAYVAAMTIAANRYTTLPALPLVQVEGLEKRWFIRLLRPVLARLLRSKTKQGEPEFLPPELRTGPFAYVTLALDGLPVARILRQTLDAAWNSPVLSQRAKALVFAVVGRGLDSKRSEQEARSLLAPHGLDEGQLDEILSHLASSKLDPIEAAIVPFARESVHYQPVEIQRRARKLREELGLEPFLELIGVIGLANATCRLSLALCEG